MVELTANGESLELIDKGNDIKYTRQIADIFDIAAVSNSYTNSFTIPKTPGNTQILSQLGITGDTSRVPYSKIPSDLKDDGLPVVKSGWLRVRETTSEYKVSIINGMIDFFKSIENKTMGTDVNLTQFDHEKTIDTVIASFDNEYYKYIIADYNGKNFGTVLGDTAINIDYLVPCFNMGKLLDLVIETFGFTSDRTNTEELDDLYITYPKPPADNVTSELIATLTKANYTLYNPTPDAGGFVSPSSQYFWDSSDVDQGSLVSNWKYVIPADYAYRFDLSIETYGQYFIRTSFGAYVSPVAKSMRIEILRNGNPALAFDSDPLNPATGSVSIFCNQGDIIDIRILALYFRDGRVIREIHHNSAEFKIYKTNQGDIILADAFKDFKVSDFFKECLWFTSTTPILDVVNKSMTFKTLEQRLDFSDAQDWSEMYVERNGEKYDSGFAQKNIFSHKYNDPDDKSLNGFLTVSDANAPSEKKLIESITFAPEQLRTTFNDSDGVESFNTYKFKIWERETKEDGDGNIGIEYKGLNQRFYFMKYRMSEVSEWLLMSEAVSGSDTVTQVPYADTTGTTYNQIVPARYARYMDVINYFKVHDIDLAMGLLDFYQADLTKPVYFSQEAQYYMLNKLTYQSGQLASGEFVRIGKIPEVPLGDIAIQVDAVSGYAVRFRIPIVAGYNDIIPEGTTVIINGVECEISSILANDVYVRFYAVIPFENYETEPVLNSFDIQTTNGTETRQNIYYGPDVIFTTADQGSGTVKTLTANLE